MRARYRALEAAVRPQTRSKHGTQLKTFDALMKYFGEADVGTGVTYFIADYVPNLAGTGAGKMRKSTGLENAVGALLAALGHREGWTPTEDQRREYRKMIRGVMVDYPAEEAKAQPVLAAHLRLIKEHLPAESGNAKQRNRVRRLYNGYALLVLMLMGLLRKGDLQHIRRENVRHETMEFEGQEVAYYIMKFQDKPRIGTRHWRHVVIVRRQDDLDAYCLLKMLLAEQAVGPLFGETDEATRLVEGVIKWVRKNVPGMSGMQGHGLRAGGLQEMQEVAGSNNSIILLQGGWSSHSAGIGHQRAIGSASSTYLRTNPRFLKALLAMGAEAP